MKNTFKKGDWCFCEFKLQQITEMEQGRITSVSDGWGSHGGYDLTDRCFPLDLKIKVASDSVDGWRNRFHAVTGARLNYPDLHRELVRRWVEITSNIHDDEFLKAAYKNLDEFGRKVIDRAKDIRQEEIDGVSIFR